MMNGEEFSDIGTISQKLTFSTPQREKAVEWKLTTTADNISRNLFDSHKKVQTSEDCLKIVMPLIIIPTP